MGQTLTDVQTQTKADLDQRVFEVWFNSIYSSLDLEGCRDLAEFMHHYKELHWDSETSTPKQPLGSFDPEYGQLYVDVKTSLSTLQEAQELMKLVKFKVFEFYADCRTPEELELEWIIFLNAAHKHAVLMNTP